MSWFTNIFIGKPSALPAPVSDAPVYDMQAASARYRWHDGEKYPGGMGPVDLLTTDYWTLRARSSDLFKRNIYARGIIRRLITNEINTGLHLEAMPEGSIVGLDDESAYSWSDEVENLFYMWANDPQLCDRSELRTFGAVQALARLEALVAGDVLVILEQDARTKLPRVRLVNGASVQSPGKAPSLPAGNRINHGVELDAAGRHVGYWISKESASSYLPESERIDAWGKRTGRRVAWLLYGTDQRLDDVRGEPLLALVLQSLKEIDRYRDSVQRKAVLNAMVAMFVEKSEDKVGSSPLGGGAQRRGTEATTDTTGAERTFNLAEYGAPGMIIDELQPGEKPQGFMPHGTDEKFGDFEGAIIQSVAWGNEMPPEILTLSFNSNYSASQAAHNEFKIYLARARESFGQCFCQPIYKEWLLSHALSRRLSMAGFLESWRDKSKYEVYGAWCGADWSGQIKPAIKMTELVAASESMVQSGFTTRTRACAELTGMRFDKVVKQLKRENEMLRDAQEALHPTDSAQPPATGATAMTPAAIAIANDDEDHSPAIRAV